jgi:hypothetical protein
MVALIAVCAILIATLNAYTTSLKSTPETEQLKNLLNHVAAKGNELLAVAAATESSAQVFIQLPAAIGHKQYWIRASNDSSSAWLEGSLGEILEDEVTCRVYLPQETSTSGFFVGGHGAAILESYMNGSTLQLNLNHSGG